MVIKINYFLVILLQHIIVLLSESQESLGY